MKFISSIVLVALLGVSSAFKIKSSMRSQQTLPGQNTTVTDNIPASDPITPYAYFLFLDPSNAQLNVRQAIRAINADFAQTVEGATDNAIQTLNDTFAAQVQTVADFFDQQTEVNEDVYSALSDDVFAIQQNLIDGFKQIGENYVSDWTTDQGIVGNGDERFNTFQEKVT